MAGTAAVVTLIGNEGFQIDVGSRRIFIDAFYGAGAYGFSRPSRSAAAVDRADLILVTHSHWDHFDAEQVASVARAAGAAVVGPASVARALRKQEIPDEQLVEMQPARLPSRSGRADSVTATVRGADLTTFRTWHSADHNSYLVEIDGFRFFHDGDNEETQVLEPAALAPVDALLLGPWQGAHWVELIEALSPKATFLMHLTDEELDQHEAGTFLPDICDHIPPGIVVLRPGQSREIA